MKVRLPKQSAPNMQELMLKAKQAQEEMERASDELEKKEYTATSGGQAVKVTVNGKIEITKIEIDPQVIDPEDPEMLSDMIIAATNEAIKKANAEKDEVLQGISGKMNLPGMF